jgi:hypothetical protein
MKDKKQIVNAVFDKLLEAKYFDKDTHGLSFVEKQELVAPALINSGDGENIEVESEVEAEPILSEEMKLSLLTRFKLGKPYDLNHFLDVMAHVYSASPDQIREALEYLKEYKRRIVNMDSKGRSRSRRGRGR